MVKVESNESIIKNLTMDRLPLFNESELYSEDDGLATQIEWNDLSEHIKYGNIRQVMKEDIITNFCLDNIHCKDMTYVQPTQNYDFSLLSVPTPGEIQASIERKLKMNFWERFVVFVEKNTAYICIFTLLFQSLLIIFTLLDLFSGNEHNVIRLFWSLLIKLLTKMVTFFCKMSTESYFKRKDKDSFQMTTFKVNDPYLEENDEFIQQTQQPENTNYIPKVKKNRISSIEIH